MNAIPEMNYKELIGVHNDTISIGMLTNAHNVY